VKGVSAKTVQTQPKSRKKGQPSNRGLYAATAIFCFVLFLFFPLFKSYAKRAVSSSLVALYYLDGKPYSREQLIIDFTRIAYQRSLWVEDILNYQRGSLAPAWRSLEPKPQLKMYPSWMVEYALRHKGRPVFDGLNKWPGEITIGIGWPPPSAQPENVQDSSRAVSQIKKVLKGLGAASGRPVKYMSPKLETEENFARIRIIEAGSERFYQDNKFKVRGRTGGPIPAPIMNGKQSDFIDFGKHGLMQDLEGRFLDAARFTPFSRSQVDGYFVSNSKNEIDFAVCYIWSGHKDVLFNALVTECLVRAMGLPETSRIAETSALSLWNTAHDSHSKRYMIDKGEANQPLRTSYGLELEDTSAESFPHQLTKTSPQALSGYDKAMISLLYCERLTAAQGRYGIIEELSANDDCFGRMLAVIEGGSSNGK
jgi:hypothetical protein